MQILWSEDAVNDYHENIEYLLKEWSEKVASQFIDEVDVVLEIIKLNPEIYPKTDYKSIRRAVIRKQITLFYQRKKDVIYLVRFWNNYKDPGSLDLAKSK
jgi:plasmid stabilization system protein ParE